jgi:hypothetical protein
MQVGVDQAVPTLLALNIIDCHLNDVSIVAVLAACCCLKCEELLLPLARVKLDLGLCCLFCNGSSATSKPDMNLLA